MKLRNGHEVSSGTKPYIVAELNSSHWGKIAVARQMIDAAKECGCDAVKFQSWTAESLYCREYYDLNPMSKRMVSGFSLNPGALRELADYCGQAGIDFSSTPYSYEETDFLIDECRAPFVKVASMDINNVPFLAYIAKKKVPVVLSTGMATMDEIRKAVSVIEKEGNDNLCILHCVSVYPVEARDVNLNNIVTLKKEFGNYCVGYSDHTIGSETACAAIGLGAAFIEKHFTLDHEKVGWDNQMAAKPADMKALVEKCHRVYQSLGSFERNVSDAEMNQRLKMRRSIVAISDLKKGHVISLSDITAKRPGDGISVSEYENVVGKILLRDIPADHMLKAEELS